MKRQSKILGAALVVALLFGASPAWAADAEETGASRYLRYLEEQGEDVGPLRTVLEGDDAEAKRDLIHAVLLLRSERYRDAVERFETGVANAEDFADILGLTPKDGEAPAAAKGDDPFLSAHASYYLGRALLRRDEPGTAALVLKSLLHEKNKHHLWPARTRLHLALAEASVPNVDAAKSTLKELLDRSGPETPERYREAAVFILRELLGEGSGPLVEIARKMEWIERRLDGGEGGTKVRKRQGEVLDTLDEMIAMLKEKQQQGQGQGEGEGKPEHSPGGT